MDRGSTNSASDLSSRRMCRRRFMVLCIVLILSVLPQDAGAQSIPEEYQVKAAFLFHFAQFVDWPANVLNTGDSSLKLCIFDDEPRRQELQSTIEGKSIGSRVIHVRQRNDDFVPFPVLIVGAILGDAHFWGMMLGSVDHVPVT